MRVYLGLGSNLGDRLENLRQGLRRLEDAGVRLLRASALYESAPLGYAEQPDFYNAVAEVETEETLPGLLRRIKAIEAEMGGRPHGRGRARPLDVDILLCGEVIFASADLLVPHPRIFERRFMMEGLLELEPGLMRTWEWMLGAGGRTNLEGQRVERVMETAEWLGARLASGMEVAGCGSRTAQPTPAGGR